MTTLIDNLVPHRMLNGEPWARERLVNHAGRVFTVRLGPLTSAFRIGDDGSLQRTPLAHATPDLALTLSPLNAPAFLADPTRWNEFVTEEGDVELGDTLKALATTMPWFVENLCTRVLGPIAGQRVAEAGRHALELPEYASKRLAENVGAYTRDEIRWLAHPAELRAMAAEAAALDARMERLAARIDGLSSQRPDNAS